jgi:hypothetical protein
LTSPSSPWTDSQRQSLTKSCTLPPAPEQPGKVLSLPLTQSRFLARALARPNAPGWPTGTGATPNRKRKPSLSGVTP